MQQLQRDGGFDDEFTEEVNTMSTNINDMSQLVN